MKGDSVDNIPGLPGVGDKTAKKFLNNLALLVTRKHIRIKGKLKKVRKIKI